ncbi:major facilitator superfamily domain-containing protein, partial [Xylogone sp. PMI_703]
LQTIWSVVMSNGTAYFTHLGISKAEISLIWIASPITSALFQPYIGAVSDRSRHPWGRRKAYIIVGTVSTIFSILLLRQSVSIAIWLTEAFGAEPRREMAHIGAQVMAILAIISFSFATCPLQASLRAFVVECCPSHQQQEATAWICRFIGVGSMLLYLLSYTSLSEWVPWLGDTQFKALCMFTCVALGATVTITCVFITEVPTHLTPLRVVKQSNGPVGLFAEIIGSARNLSSRVKRTMLVQSCSWYSWFTFLYYCTSYVLYSPSPTDSAVLDSKPIISLKQTYNITEREAIISQGTQVGSLAMFYFAAAGLASNIILPFFLLTPSSALTTGAATQVRNTTNIRKIPHLSLADAWMGSLLLLGICMLVIATTTDFRVGIASASMMGISWAMTQWAPLAIINAELSNRQLKDLELGHRIRGEETGTVMGIYNTAIAAPQVLAALGSGIVFWTLNTIGITDQIRWALGIAGLPAFIAAWFAYKL